MNKYDRQRCKKHLWIGCLLLWTMYSNATGSQATTEQLRGLEASIQKLEAQMHNTRSEYERLQNQLEGSEKNIGEVALTLEELQGKLTSKEKTLADLKTKHKEHTTQLHKQRQALAQQIRTAYMIGRQDYLKLLLNQEDPFAIGRVLTYYDYFNRARTHQINTINTTLQQLHLLEQRIQQEAVQLGRLAGEKNDNTEKLNSSYHKRQAILAQLANTLESQDKELKRLREDKSQLEVFLGTLGDALSSIPQPQGEEVSFAHLKGRLPYPVQGQVLNHFGDPLIGNLKWQGMLIAASKGEKVYTVAAGRVAFAQWFRHLGLLVIIEHGKGYMTLYAHNQSLYTKVGEWVKAHDVIASIGNSGGRHIDGLYFEVRHQGIPVDPIKWLRP
jgi:septal ring factor EnvC (AmiA/AmiB activator)